MSSVPDTPALAVPSPCIGQCRLDAAGYCIGCRRDIDEIMHWREYDDARRRHIMDVLLPTREHS